jgi:hypothetical protein
MGMPLSEECVCVCVCVCACVSVCVCYAQGLRDATPPFDAVIQSLQVNWLEASHQSRLEGQRQKAEATPPFDGVVQDPSK